MKKLALVTVAVLGFVNSNAQAASIDDLSGVLINTVASDLSQVRDTIQQQVQQSIADSVAELFNESVVETTSSNTVNANQEE